MNLTLAGYATGGAPAIPCSTYPHRLRKIIRLKSLLFKIFLGSFVRQSYSAYSRTSPIPPWQMRGSLTI